MENGGIDIELANRQSQAQPSRHYAVFVKDACKRYGTKKNPLPILDGLNMAVPKGVIYGLLGASGCGKTTLLSCIVGCKKLNSGDILVLGRRPSLRQRSISNRIGYMPQELAQYGQFSIRETFKFYGWVSGMSNSKIKERTEFLVKLLVLPSADTMVQDLSTGQQRRVSLASALLHEPELLILDEPTVGADPMLREIIWNHFVDITKNGQTTIIITTHYIDETRQANLVALMRGGFFLAEESPQKLMARVGTETLEDAFLKLSVVQNIGRRRRSFIAQEVARVTQLPTGIINEAATLDNLDTDAGAASNISGEFGDTISVHSSSSKRNSVALPDDSAVTPAEIPVEEVHLTKISDYLIVLKRNHIKALMWKNMLWILRNIPMLVFLIIIPGIQLAIFFTCIGRDPRHLPIAVVNYETGNDVHCRSPISCNGTKLSCNYLRYLEKRSFILIPYGSEEAAKQSVFTGKTFASVFIQHNYSAALHTRIKDWEFADQWNVNNSRIDIVPDLSNKAIATFLRASFYDTFKDFIGDYLEACDIDKRILRSPVKFETAVYGQSIPDFTNFMAPGVLVSLAFMLGAVLTAFVVFTERHEGTFDRYVVAGISEVELIFSHFMCELLISICQSILATVFSFAVFDVTVVGSVVLATFLVILTGVCGMGYGFIISCLSNNERTVDLMILGSFMPLITFCGILWPIEGMRYFLQVIAAILPITKPSEALRSIMQRGWGFSTEVVYISVITLVIWTIIFMVVSVLSVKLRKS